MKNAPKLTDAERSEIGILLGKGYSGRSIAAALGRSPNTVSDEIRRNSVRGVYVVASAKRKSYLKRKYAKYQGKKIQENQALRDYVIAGLKAHWNPDEIAGAMQETCQPFYASKTTIYEWLYSECGAIQLTVGEMLSLSLDNGIENRWHAKLTVPAYFCDPYSSWQKGGVENANKMIRRYLPKGMDLAEVTPRHLQAIIRIINNKPRKILGYKSALDVAREKGVLRD